MFHQVIFRRRNPLNISAKCGPKRRAGGRESRPRAVYAPPDPTIARHQIERLRAALQYITLVRDDENATPEQKAADIASLDRHQAETRDHCKYSGSASRALGDNPAGSVERAGAGDAPHDP